MDRKIYDRERARAIYKDFILRRRKILDQFGGKCFLCSSESKKGFNLHHIEYHPTESKYPKHSKNMHVRLKRLNEAEQNPHRFKLLCPSCHRLTESLRSAMNRRSINLEILIKLIK